MRTLLLLLLISPAFCLSQSREKLKENSFNSDNFKEFPIEIKTGKKDKPLDVHYGSAGFIDARADSSKLGFTLAGASADMEYHNIIFPKPAAAYLGEKATSLLNTDPAKTGRLVFVLKHLWVTERIIRAPALKSILTGPINYLSLCYVNSDCYSAENGRYTYLGTVDTVVSFKRWLVGSADELLKKTLTDLLNTGESLLMSTDTRPAAISYEELIQKIRSGFDLPILQANQPAKGVYYTYIDFLNNKPSVTDFTVIKDKKTETLSNPGGDDVLLNKAWGYFDGTDLQVHINNNYYRMSRHQNTFEIAGPRTLDKFYGTGDKIFAATLNGFFGGIVSGGVTLMMMGSANKIVKELVPYQLNIADGLVY